MTNGQVTAKAPPRRKTPSSEPVRRPGFGLICVTVPLVFLAFFFALPIMLMVVTSLTAKGSIASVSFQNYAEFFSKPVLWGALSNSAELTALTVLISLPLAYALAACVAFAVPSRWQPVIIALLVLPFFTSYIVRTYAWLLVLSDRGIVNASLIAIGLIDRPLTLVNARTGVVIVFVHYFMMIMTLAIYVNLKRIPQNLIKAARDLGASPFGVFVNVILPLSIPGIAVGVFLTIVIAVGDYVTPQVIGGGKELTLPQAIMLQIGRFANMPLASALSFILTLLIVAVLVTFSPWLRARRSS
jgi:spermidine/putrescine transport system permease protein